MSATERLAVDALSGCIAALVALIKEAAREGAMLAMADQAPKSRTERQDRPLVSKQAAANALGISIATLDRRLRDSVVPFVQVGAVKRFDIDAVRAAFAAGTVSSQPPARKSAHSDGVALGGVRLLSRTAESKPPAMRNPARARSPT